MAPPQLGDEQIVCGPDWPDERAPDGRWISLHTPVGSYDLSVVARKLAPEQEPDVVVCLVDASWRNMPGQLGSFRCPVVLLVADTHHMHEPLARMVRYARSEPFTRIVLLYDRHHAKLLQSAGLKDLFWFPGLTFPHSDAAVHRARSRARQRRIAFVGQAGEHHPRRRRLLEALADAQVPVVWEKTGQSGALTFYGASLAAFNASLNSDLNLRVFEVLATGAALLTDRLAAESGLASLLREGREMVTYGGTEELVRLAREALASPSETMAIGAAGAQWFDEHFGEERRRNGFRTLAFEGCSLPEFELPRTPTLFFGGQPEKLRAALTVYEVVQEKHRLEDEVVVAVEPDAADEVGDLFGSLPRVRVSTSLDKPADLLIVSGKHGVRDAGGAAERVWCVDITAAEAAGLVGRLTTSGLAPRRDCASYFERKPCGVLREDPATLLRLARSHLAEGNARAAGEAAQKLVRIDPRNGAGYGELGRALVRFERYDAAVAAFKLASHLDRENAEWKLELGTALHAWGQTAEAKKAWGEAVMLGSSRAEVWFRLGRALFEEGLSRQAAIAFERVISMEPTNAQAERWLERSTGRSASPSVGAAK